MPSIENLHNYEAEMAMIGLFLAQPTNIGRAINDGLRAEYFFDPHRRRIAEEILNLHAAQQVVDMITVSQKLRSEEPLINWSLEMEHCVDNAMLTATHLTYYIEMLRDLYQKREIYRIMTTEAPDLLDENTPVDDVCGALVFSITQVQNEHVHTEAHDEMVTRVMTAINAGSYAVVPCKIPRVRRLMSGWPKGKVALVAARPGTGKSTFMCNEAYWCAKHGVRTGVISLEMDKEELLTIMCCEDMAISSFELKRGHVTPNEKHAFETRMRELDTLPLWVTDRGMTIQQVTSWIKTMRVHQNIDIVFLDYIQRIRSGGGRKKRFEEVAEWSGLLADTAKETGISIVSLAQLSRASEPPPGLKSEDAWKYTPKLHHLKESGALEEDAYLAVLLYPHPVNAVLDGNGLHLRYVAHVAKHRGGPIGEVDLIYFKDIQRFVCEEIHDDPGFSQEELFPDNNNDEVPF